MNDDYIMTPPSDRSREGAAESDGIQLPICRRVLTTELSGDFSLPDYQPEIKRLLRIGVSVMPPERYVSGDSLELEGSLDYFALYMGNDHQLYCAPLTTEYRMNLPLSEERERERDHGRPIGAPSPLDGEITCSCDVTADPVTGRVTAPRRLSIKSRLKAAVNVYGTCRPAANTADEAANDAVERLPDTLEVAHLCRGVGETLSLQDDMILSPAENGDVRVICAEGQVMVHEASAGQGMVTCRGDVLLKLTLAPADTSEEEPSLPTVTTRKIPFSQVVEIPEVTPASTCCAHGSCAEMSIEVEEDRLHTELGVLLEVLAQKTLRTAYTKDLYSTRKKTDCAYVTYPVKKPLGCFNGNFTLSDSLSLTDAGIHPAARVIDVTATAFPEDLAVDTDRNRCVLSGRCRVQLLLYREGEYTTAELDLPFHYEKDGGLSSGATQAAAPAYDGCVRAMACRARLDGERIGIDAELAVALRMTDEDTLTTLATVDFGEDVTRRRGEYVICFPAADDTLWSVAKRYHAPIAALSAANALSLTDTPDHPDSLSGISYLIV